MQVARSSRLGVLAIILASAVVQTGCGGSSGSKSGNSAGPTAALCQKLEDCGAVTPDSLAACQDLFKSMEMYVIDPAAVSACLSQATCTQIQDQAFVQQCIGYDTSTFHCSGITLHFCNLSGKCADIDCSSTCRQFFSSTTSASCSFDSQDQHDKCFCYM